MARDSLSFRLPPISSLIKLTLSFNFSVRSSGDRAKLGSRVAKESSAGAVWVPPVVVVGRVVDWEECGFVLDARDSLL